MIDTTEVIDLDAALAELGPEHRPGDENAIIALRRQIDVRLEARSAIVAQARLEQRDDLRASEDREFRRITGEVDRLNEALVAHEREMARAASRSAGCTPAPASASGARPPPTAPHSDNSYFRDLMLSKRDADPDAQDRLRRHAAEVRAGAEQRVRQGHHEYRALSRVDTAGGHFVPPLHLVDSWIELARASRPTANVLNRRPLPSGTDSIVIPKVSTGTATAIQTADNAAVQETDLVDTTVTAPVKPIAGQQDVAVQLLDQSPVPMDDIIFADLIADLNTKLNTQVLSGSGASGQVTGLRNVSGAASVTYTDVSPTVGELYAKLADAIQRVATGRFLPPTVIVMHPRRWAWFLSALDTSNRPLVVPNGNAAFNPVATANPDTAQGVVGELLGLRVVADPSIPTTLGTGSNEDQILVLRAEDSWLFESSVRTRALPDVGSGTLTVRLQAYGYLALATRYAESIATISGSGPAAPTF